MLDNWSFFDENNISTIIMYVNWHALSRRDPSPLLAFLLVSMRCLDADCAVKPDFCQVEAIKQLTFSFYLVFPPKAPKMHVCSVHIEKWDTRNNAQQPARWGWCSCRIMWWERSRGEVVGVSVWKNRIYVRERMQNWRKTSREACLAFQH